MTFPTASAPPLPTAPFEVNEKESQFPAVAGCPWWVIHTRPRCEKKMDQWLADQEMTHFLPVRRVLRSYQSKSIARELPLFIGYAFAAFPVTDSRRVYASGHAARLLEVVDQETFLGQMDTIRRLTLAGLDIQSCEYLTVGKRVKIHGGVLKGLGGIVQRISGKTRLIVSVELLQASVAVEVESAWLSLDV